MERASVCRRAQKRLKLPQFCWDRGAGRMVRIHFPPAERVCKLSVPKMSALGERYGRDALGRGNLSLEEASNCGPECASAHYRSNPH